MLPTSTRAAVYERGGGIAVRDIDLTPLAAGELLVRITACGICPGESMGWYNDRKAPFVLGHEPVAVIDNRLCYPRPGVANPTRWRRSTVNRQHRLTEEMSAGPARLRVDVFGGEPRAHVLEDMAFLDYRLGHVEISPEVTLTSPDIVWDQDGDRAVAYDGRTMQLDGPWPAGPIQKIVVALLASAMFVMLLTTHLVAAAIFAGLALVAVAAWHSKEPQEA